MNVWVIIIATITATRFIGGRPETAAAPTNRGARLFTCTPGIKPVKVPSPTPSSVQASASNI